jgi:hypothetical protein
MGNELSGELSLFIKQYITSLEQLEILLLLFKEPNRAWTIEQVFKVTQTNPDSVAKRLTGMVQSGFLVGEDAAASTFRFEPRTHEIRQHMSELQRAYAVSKYKIIEAIFSAPQSPAQQFADSFKIKREK